MAVKEGYKQTGMGVIPAQWNICRIDEIAEVKGGKRLPKGKFLSNSKTPYPYIKVTDMYQGGVSLNEIQYVPIDMFPLIKNYRIYKTDLFISVAGTLGLVGKVPEILDGANLTENADRLTNIKCNTDFLLQVLMSSIVQDYIEVDRTIGAQPKLALTRIKKFLIPFPPLIEQRAIAKVLNDVSTLINNLDALITKKLNIKQAAIQQLLSGKKRLPGFTKAWEVKKLGEVATIIKGNGLSKEKLALSGGKKCILYGELYTRYSEVITNVVSRTHFVEGRLSQHGDVLIPSSTTTTGIDLATASALLEDNILIGGDIIILRSKGGFYSSEFLSRYLTHIKKHEIAERAQGITIIHLYGKDLADLSIDLPPITEQLAITKFFSDMNAEIERLKQKRDKIKALKQGMMQELLTGKTRLL